MTDLNRGMGDIFASFLLVGTDRVPDVLYKTFPGLILLGEQGGGKSLFSETLVGEQFNISYDGKATRCPVFISCRPGSSLEIRMTLNGKEEKFTDPESCKKRLVEVMAPMDKLQEDIVRVDVASPRCLKSFTMLDLPGFNPNLLETHTDAVKIARKYLGTYTGAVVLYFQPLALEEDQEKNLMTNEDVKDLLKSHAANTTVVFSKLDKHSSNDAQLSGLCNRHLQRCQDACGSDRCFFVSLKTDSHRTLPEQEDFDKLAVQKALGNDELNGKIGFSSLIQELLNGNLNRRQHEWAIDYRGQLQTFFNELSSELSARTNRGHLITLRQELVKAFKSLWDGNELSYVDEAKKKAHYPAPTRTKCLSTAAKEVKEGNVIFEKFQYPSDSKGLRGSSCLASLLAWLKRAIFAMNPSSGVANMQSRILRHLKIEKGTGAVYVLKSLIATATDVLTDCGELTRIIELFTTAVKHHLEDLLAFSCHFIKQESGECEVEMKVLKPQALEILKMYVDRLRSVALSQQKDMAYYDENIFLAVTFTGNVDANRQDYTSDMLTKYDQLMSKKSQNDFGLPEQLKPLLKQAGTCSTDKQLNYAVSAVQHIMLFFLQYYSTRIESVFNFEVARNIEEVFDHQLEKAFSSAKFDDDPVLRKLEKAKEFLEQGLSRI